MKRWPPALIGLMFLLSVAACSTRDRFVDAAAAEGTVTDRKVLECAADKLEKKLSGDEFSQLVDELEKIADKKMKMTDANMKLMGAMTAATGACAVSDLLGLGGKKN